MKGKESVENKNIELDINDDKSEYLSFIKESVENKSYFKDAFDWYSFRYISPICDRTLLIFGSVLASIVFFLLVQIVKSVFPLVEEVPIFISAKDKSTYFPNLLDLKPAKGQDDYDQNINNVDEAVAKYLLSIYVKKREGYNFSKAEVEEVNNKFNYIKNNSTSDEYKAFQIAMSKDNPDSPINFFGKKVEKEVEVESVKFIRKKMTGITNQAKNFIIQEIPSEAEVRFIATTRSTSSDADIKPRSIRYIAKIKFDFEGIKKNQKGNLSFVVKGYRLFIVR